MNNYKKSSKTKKNKPITTKKNKGGTKSILKKSSSITDRYKPEYIKRKRLSFTSDTNSNSLPIRDKNKTTKPRRYTRYNSRNEKVMDKLQKNAERSGKFITSDFYKKLDERETDIINNVLRNIKRPHYI